MLANVSTWGFCLTIIAPERKPMVTEGSRRWPTVVESNSEIKMSGPTVTAVTSGTLETMRNEEETRYEFRKIAI
jgi:hypothetical protein